MATRKIVQIDQSRCDGCGLCVPSCAEGAIQVIAGKARLLSDVYCDGLGACLGECPQGAIAIVEREAEAFDEQAVHRHVAATAKPPAQARERPAAIPVSAPRPSGCPGSMARTLNVEVPPTGRSAPQGPGGQGPPDEEPSALGNWPLQLHLVPPTAPYLQNADLLLAADCVPFALADFHRRFLRGRPVVIGCPKLDDGEAYVAKLVSILTLSSIRSLTVVHMEVPCCQGLVRIAQAALAATGAAVPLEDVTISIRGRVLNPRKARD